jgi:hypothetical protein
LRRLCSKWIVLRSRRRNTLLPALLGWATVSGYDADLLACFYPDTWPIFSSALTPDPGSSGPRLRELQSLGVEEDGKESVSRNACRGNTPCVALSMPRRSPRPRPSFAIHNSR